MFIKFVKICQHVFNLKPSLFELYTVDDLSSSVSIIMYIVYSVSAFCLFLALKSCKNITIMLCSICYDLFEVYSIILTKY
jgi:hypothetical protein